MTTSKFVRTSQPQGPVGIDWANPITDGLVWLGGYFGGDALQINQGITSHLLNYANNALIRETPTGPQFEVTGVAGGFRAVSENGLDAIGTGDCTVFVRLRPKQLTATKVAFGRYNGGNDWWIGHGNAGQAQASFLGALLVGPTLRNNEDSILIIIRQNGGAILLLNGNIVAGQTSIATFGGMNGLALGNFGFTGGYAYTGTVSIGGIYSRALSVQEARSLSTNPWQIFQPIEKPIFVGLAAAEEAANEVSIGTILEGVQLVSSIGIVSVNATENVNITLPSVVNSTSIGELLAEGINGNTLVPTTKYIKHEYRDFINLWVPDQSGMVDIIGGVSAFTKTGTNVGLLPSSGGIGVQGTATSNVLSGYNTPQTVLRIGGADSVTCVAVITISNTSSTSEAILLRYQPDTTNNILSMAIFPSTGAIRTIFKNSGTTGWTVSGDTTHSLQIGKTYVLISRWKAGSPVQTSAVEIGRPLNWKNTANAPTGTINVPLSTSVLRIGGPLELSATQATAPGTIHLLGVSTEYLSDAQAASITRSPSAYLNPLNLLIPAQQAGGVDAQVDLPSVSSNTFIGQLATLTSVLAPITGSQASTLLGTITARSSAATILQSLASSSSVGTISASNLDNGNIAIQGIQVTTSLGALTTQATSTTSLLGQQAVSSVAAPTATGTASNQLLGIQANTSIGTLDVIASSPATGVVIGQHATSSVGSLNVSATRSASLTLSGVLANSAVGILTATVSVATTPQGNQANSSVGILLASGTHSASTTLTGVSATTNKGTITAYTNVTISLNGVPVSTTVGTLQIAAGARLTLPSVTSTISLGNVNAEGNFPYTVSLRYYDPLAQNNVLVPESKNNILVPEAHNTIAATPESRSNVLIVESKSNVLAPETRTVALDKSPMRNLIFNAILRITSFFSPKRDN